MLLGCLRPLFYNYRGFKLLGPRIKYSNKGYCQLGHRGMLCILGLDTVSAPSGARILRFYVIECTSALEWSPEANLR